MLHEGVCAFVPHILTAFTWRFRYWSDVCCFCVWFDTKRTESMANTWLRAVVALFDDHFLRVHARRKSLSIFHHYLSLFLMSDIFRLTVSNINGVIDA